MRWDAPRHEYAGNVIDGPWRGRKHVSRHQDFRLMVAPPKSVFDFDPDDAVCETVVCTEVTYRWSFSLGEWCMVY